MSVSRNQGEDTRAGSRPRRCVRATGPGSPYAPVLGGAGEIEVTRYKSHCLPFGPWNQ